MIRIARVTWAQTVGRRCIPIHMILHVIQLRVIAQTRTNMCGIRLSLGVLSIQFVSIAEKAVPSG
jgi:hypothetical protein